jgi:acyl-CoA reductase-like NAD-dependent aldehyde dehydrogenase
MTLYANLASGKTFPVYNPATGAVTAQVAEADREDGWFKDGDV